MIYEYAVSPALFSNSKDVGFLLDSFGKGKGRLISRVPKKRNWLRQVFAVIAKSSYGPVERKKLKVAANRLQKHAGYTRVEQSDFPGSDWLQVALEAHRLRPFQGIIVDKYTGDNHLIIENNLDLRSNQAWNIPFGISVERDAKKMVGIIQPMLECAREVILIDRNFQPKYDRFTNVLSEIIDKLSNKKFGPTVQKVTYQLGDKEGGWGDYIKGQVNRRRFLNKVPATFTIEIGLRPWSELHDRFVLTDIGGVFFGVGLDESLGGGVQDVRIKLLSGDDYRAEWKKAKQTGVFFSLKGIHQY